MPARDLAERLGMRSGDRPGGGPEPVVRAAVLEVFRERHEAGRRRAAASSARATAAAMLASTSSRASSWTRATDRVIAASYASGRMRPGVPSGGVQGALV